MNPSLSSLSAPEPAALPGHPPVVLGSALPDAPDGFGESPLGSGPTAGTFADLLATTPGGRGSRSAPAAVFPVRIPDQASADRGGFLAAREAPAALVTSLPAPDFSGEAGARPSSPATPRKSAAVPTSAEEQEQALAFFASLWTRIDPAPAASPDPSHLAPALPMVPAASAPTPASMSDSTPRLSASSAVQPASPSAPTEIAASATRINPIPAPDGYSCSSAISRASEPPSGPGLSRRAAAAACSPTESFPLPMAPAALLSQTPAPGLRPTLPAPVFGFPAEATAAAPFPHPPAGADPVSPATVPGNGGMPVATDATRTAAFASHAAGCSPAPASPPPETTASRPLADPKSVSATGAREQSACTAIAREGSVLLPASLSLAPSVPLEAAPGRPVISAASSASAAGRKSLPGLPGEKQFLSTRGQEVGAQPSAAGISVAETASSMSPSARTARRPLSITTDAEELPESRNAAELFPLLSQPARDTSASPTAPPATAPIALPAATAQQAVGTVLTLVEQLAQARAAGGAVTLTFKFGHQDLAVRVQLRDGKLHTRFRTDSPDLRAALAQEWQAVTPAHTPASLILAAPEFTPATEPAGAPFSATSGGFTQSGSHFRQQSADSSSAPFPEAPAPRRARQTLAPPPATASSRAPVLSPRSLHLTAVA